MVVADASGARKRLVGITEDVPADRWQQNFLTINRALRQHGRY
jgi:hypothetical protein